eukprot:SAG11_NODE_1057_length_6008_cov_3.405991_3_plen_672_part_00
MNDADLLEVLNFRADRQAQRDRLQCSLCLELRVPLYQCHNGHVHCGDCHEDPQFDRTCRPPCLFRGVWQRNRLAEVEVESWLKIHQLKRRRKERRQQQLTGASAHSNATSATVFGARTTAVATAPATAALGEQSPRSRPRAPPRSNRRGVHFLEEHEADHIGRQSGSAAMEGGGGPGRVVSMEATGELAEAAPSLWAHGEGEIAQLIWERLPPLELVRARGVARVWRDGIDALPRWIPIVPAPGVNPARSLLQLFADWWAWCEARLAIEDEIVDLEDEIEQAERTFMTVMKPGFLRSLNQQLEDREARLAGQDSAYDGWAALAPFTRTRADEDVTWLRGALGLAGPACTRRRWRSAGRTELRHYFQIRERDAGEAFRTWRSTPVHDFLRDAVDESSDEGDELEDRAAGRGDAVFSPSAVPRLEAERRVLLVVAHAPGLRQHDARAVERKLALAEGVLSCYLQTEGIYEVRRGEDVQLVQVDGLTRQCVQGTGVTQLDAQHVLHQMRMQDLEFPERSDENAQLVARQMKEATVTYIAAPHLYSHTVDLAWFFSSPLSGGRGWVISTHQFDEAGLTPCQSMRGFVQTLIYSSLHATGLAACENSPCCMNNADGVESMLTTSMLLCPGCLRKLQLIGAMPNVSGGLRSLRERLAAEGPGFEDDLQTLEEWGVVA